MNTKSERLCKKVIENQKRMAYENCLYSGIKEDADKYKVDFDEVTKMKKCEWKRIVKRQLRESIEKQSIEKEAKYIKLRHQKH